MKKTILALLLAATAMMGQAPAPNNAAGSLNLGTLPVGFVAVGNTYNTTAATPTSSAFVTVAVQLGSSTSRVYSETSVDFTPAAYSIRTGMSYALFQFRGLTFAPHADGGVTSSSTASLGAISGGFSLLYDVSRVPVLKKFKGCYLVGVMRLIAVSSTATKPIYEYGIAKSFN